MKRRTFILSLAGSAAVLGWAGWNSGLSHSSQRVGKLARLSRSSWALGTHVRLTVFHNDAGKASAAIRAAFRELDAVEDVLSLYRENSQISRLNREGKLDKAHPHLLTVIERATQLSTQTAGAFDITVQPLYELHASAAADGRRPDPKAIATVLKDVDWRRVKVLGEAIRLEGRGTRITLNGIAQGFAADAVAAVLRSHGVEHALIDTGEVGTVGTHAERDNWRIGIKHPRESGGLLAMARLKGRCLATSGDYETRFGSGYDHHHLLDPQTGHSPRGLSSVSVAAPTAFEADALSTALFLTGLEKGQQLIESTPGADALFVTKNGRMMPTAGFPMES